MAVRTLRQVPRLIARTPAIGPIVQIRDRVGTATTSAPARRAVFLNLSARVVGGEPTAPSAVGPAAEGLARRQDEIGHRLGSIGERLACETERIDRRHHALEARLLEVQACFASALERIAEDVQCIGTRVQEQSTMNHESDLPRVEEQLHDRLDRLAERAARPGLGDDAATARLAALEESVSQLGNELSQLGDLQAVLDGGMGRLRSGLDELTKVTKALALGQATPDTQPQTSATCRPVVPAAPVDRRRTLLRGGPCPETGAEVMVDRAPVGGGPGGLEDKQLKAQLAMLESMTDAALSASSDASGVEHLRADLRVLAERLAAHEEVLTGLGRSVERVRRAPAKPST